MKKIVCLLACTCLNFYLSFSQVGIGTTTPDASSILDVESTDKGILIPRLTDAQIAAIVNPAIGLMVFNTSTNMFQYNSGSPSTPIWSAIQTSASSSAYFGSFIISSTGTTTITGLPFMPSQIKFTACANVETNNLNSDNGVGNNNSGLANAFGMMSGYASNFGGSIAQQVMYIGGSGNSINDISRYASSSHAIGIRYSNQNGDSLGLTNASLSSFNSNGFTLNVTNHSDDILVIYEAYR